MSQIENAFCSSPENDAAATVAHLIKMVSNHEARLGKDHRTTERARQRLAEARRRHEELTK